MKGGPVVPRTWRPLDSLPASFMQPYCSSLWRVCNRCSRTAVKTALVAAHAPPWPKAPEGRARFLTAGRE